MEKENRHAPNNGHGDLILNLGLRIDKLKFIETCDAVTIQQGSSVGC
jgi:hypothetical protein